MTCKLFAFGVNESVEKVKVLYFEIFVKNKYHCKIILNLIFLIPTLIHILNLAWFINELI